MIKKILLFMILSISSFALRINNIDMDVNVKVGELKTKTFTLENNKEYPLRYKLSIENNINGVKVNPSTLLIPSFNKRDFKVSVIGDKKGKKNYFLILEEEKLNLKSKGSSAKVKMKYRIEQKYIVE